MTWYKEEEIKNKIEIIGDFCLKHLFDIVILYRIKYFRSSRDFLFISSAKGIYSNLFLSIIKRKYANKTNSEKSSCSVAKTIAC